MKYAALFLLLALYSCSGIHAESPVVQSNVNYNNQNIAPARCSQVTDYIQNYEFKQWKKTIQRIRNT